MRLDAMSDIIKEVASLQQVVQSCKQMQQHPNKSQWKNWFKLLEDWDSDAKHTDQGDRWFPTVLMFWSSRVQTENLWMNFIIEARAVLRKKETSQCSELHSRDLSTKTMYWQCFTVWVNNQFTLQLSSMSSAALWVLDNQALKTEKWDWWQSEVQRNRERERERDRWLMICWICCLWTFTWTQNLFRCVCPWFSS